MSSASADGHQWTLLGVVLMALGGTAGCSGPTSPAVRSDPAPRGQLADAALSADAEASSRDAAVDAAADQPQTVAEQLVDTMPPAPADASPAATATHKVDDLLRCRAPWRCTVSQSPRGTAEDQIRSRYGEPYWAGDDVLVYRAPHDCADGSQHVSFHLRRGHVGRVSVSWSLGDAGCHPEASNYSPNSKPFPLRGCGQRARKCPAANKLRGRSEAQVISHFGFPHSVERGRWSYRFPRDCSDWREVLTIRWAGGRVRAVRWESRYTGEHCLDPF